ncbi:hypothetical protein K7X08_025109 [Anisodus acutangulus]|uniref:Uncharacterized protein n=1 Tax=Anisodus acutangulus TaxID=402998 RepID=A0A9Q1M9M7_9SOLA|nr:hypothetical protein K7X08_025109 [Anisodus acutangulus]
MKTGIPRIDRIDRGGEKGLPAIEAELYRIKTQLSALDPLEIVLAGPILPPTSELFSTQPRVRTKPRVNHSHERDDVEEDDDDDRSEKESESELDSDMGDDPLASARPTVRPAVGPVISLGTIIEPAPVLETEPTGQTIAPVDRVDGDMTQTDA